MSSLMYWGWFSVGLSSRIRQWRYRIMSLVFILWCGVSQYIIIFRGVFHIYSDPKIWHNCLEAVGNVVMKCRVGCHCSCHRIFNVLYCVPRRKFMMEYKLVCSLRFQQVVCEVWETKVGGRLDPVQGSAKSLD